jgi:pyruvate/2-oxoglutarate/acetoin dehydrogenase E1 component/TPP-dependent pyruvate/acetoin dehydrogenase alpha subunit
MSEALLEPPAAELPLPPEQILNDYRQAYRSRQASLIGRREVMSGKAKFGIFGDGKEVVQLAMARAFRKGDWRSGYYRDQTFMFALGELSYRQFFAQLYAHADVEADPATAGRTMNAHFATRSLDADGNWKNLADQHNSACDVSPTSSQMPRLVGLAYASVLFRRNEGLHPYRRFSHNGDEVAFGTIGNASCAEGLFWESLNAIGVLKAPAVITVYDDGYGISVTNDLQVTRSSISELLKGFQRRKGSHDGYDLHVVKGWDYPTLLDVYQKAAETARTEHVPSLIHAVELTQPQGHSTSGSHERYKSRQRLAWEQEHDCLRKLREWVLMHNLTDEKALAEMEEADRDAVEEERRQAWEAYTAPIRAERMQVAGLIDALADGSPHAAELRAVRERMFSLPIPLRRDLLTAARDALIAVRAEPAPIRAPLIAWKQAVLAAGEERYSSQLYSPGPGSVLSVPVVEPIYSDASPVVYGFEVVNAGFDAALSREPRLVAFGEDVGRLGDVNQGFRGLQARYGELRVVDTGIREATILGQAIGLALRGLRPIAEIQYLDYLLYALQLMSDDLATLRWRTKGGQAAPVIVRTRGHRLEGVWHSGSLMAGILHLVRGMLVLTPRNMTQAAGFYNTLLQAEEPGIVVEVLNGYRSKERLPDNIAAFTLPVGVPEVLRQGDDVTIVTYGACCRIALDGAEQLERVGVSAEVLDARSLLPFDIHGRTVESLRKTGRIVFMDEDVPGGTTAYLLREVLERQGGYEWLDSPPVTLPGKPHRPAYGSDGDYWSKPNAETVFEAVYRMMNEVDPRRYPPFF